MASMIYTIIASQNIKIPGQIVQFLDNPGKPWMVGKYAIAYKNLNKMRKEIKLVTIIIKFYFNLLSVHVEAFFASLACAEIGTCHNTTTAPTPLSFTQCCFSL